MAITMEDKHDSVAPSPSYTNTLSRNDGEEWRAAMQSELESLESVNTWELAEIPKERETIKLKWVYSLKRNSESKVIQRKERLVYKGYSQIEGIDFTEVFSSMARYVTIRLIFSITVYHDLNRKLIDTKNACINAKESEGLYVQQSGRFQISYLRQLPKSLIKHYMGSDKHQRSDLIISLRSCDKWETKKLRPTNLCTYCERTEGLLSLRSMLTKCVCGK